MKKQGRQSVQMKRLDARRRRIRTRWTRPAVCSVASALVFAGVGWWSWHSGLFDRGLAYMGAIYNSANRAAGLVVHEILVEGRKETSLAVILDSLGVERGDLVLKFDVGTARRRLEAIGWIVSARVERHLPDTIKLSIIERDPIVIWQRRDDFVLVDASGTVIGSDGLDRYRKLKVVVGEDAPAHAQALIAMLTKHPALMARVNVAVRSGGRRWNLRMDNDISVRLPETDAAFAWDRLAKYEEQHKLLDRDIGSIDLRLPDRVVVKLRPGGNEENSRKGRRT